MTMTLPTRFVRIAAVVALSVLGVGCGTTAVDDASPVRAAAPAETEVDGDAGEPGDVHAAAPTSGQDVAAGDETVATETRIVLDGEGLAVADGSGAMRRMVFEEVDPAVVTSTLTAAFGPATSEGTVEECGLDVVNWDGMGVHYSGGDFVGWYVAQPAPTSLTTANGIGLGMTRSALEDSGSVVTVTETTIGTEWTAGVAGTLSSDAPDATVSAIWAGVTCIAR